LIHQLRTADLFQYCELLSTEYSNPVLSIVVSALDERTNRPLQGVNIFRRQLLSCC